MKDKIFIPSYKYGTAKGTAITYHRKPQISKSAKVVGLFIAAAVSAGVIYAIYNDDGNDNNTSTGSWYRSYRSNTSTPVNSEDSGHISTGAKGGIGSNAVSGGGE